MYKEPLITPAKVYIGSFYLILVKQAMYSNHDTVRRVTVVNLKYKNYSYSWNHMLYLEMIPMHIPLHCIKIRHKQQVQWFKGRLITFVVHFMVD